MAQTVWRLKALGSAALGANIHETLTETRSAGLLSETTWHKRSDLRPRFTPSQSAALSAPSTNCASLMKSNRPPSMAQSLSFFVARVIIPPTFPIGENGETSYSEAKPMLGRLVAQQPHFHCAVRMKSFGGRISAWRRNSSRPIFSSIFKKTQPDDGRAGGSGSRRAWAMTLVEEKAQPGDIKAACKALNLSRATYCRRLKQTASPPPRRQSLNLPHFTGRQKGRPENQPRLPQTQALPRQCLYGRNPTWKGSGQSGKRSQAFKKSRPRLQQHRPMARPTLNPRAPIGQKE